jgi:hypothetical protein
MGYGAFMTVVNNRAGQVLTFVTDVDCMYDNGDEGSNLSLFNDAKIEAGGSLPGGGNGQYIEAKASGSCFFNPSTFTLKVEDAATATIIGHVVFTDNSQNWTYENDNQDVIDVYCNNSGDQARIKVTIEKT